MSAWEALVVPKQLLGAPALCFENSRVVKLSFSNVLPPLSKWPPMVTHFKHNIKISVKDQSIETNSDVAVKEQNEDSTSN